MARIVVTGATGFVGGRVARRLREHGDHVVALGRREDDALAEAGIEQRVVTLTDAEQLAAGLVDDAGVPVDGIVHAAATAGPDLDAVRAVNRDGTRAVVDAAISVGVPRLVHVSTTSVYDLDALGDIEVDEEAACVTEASWPDGALDPYALTKAEAETEVGRAVDAGLSAQILRPPAVLGAGPTSTWGTRVPRRFQDGDLPPRPPATTFGFVHVEDLVDAVLASLSQHTTRTSNVIGGHATFGDYLTALRTFLPGPPATQMATNDAPWRGRYATTRLGDTLGLRIGRTFDEAMAEIAASWSEGDPGTIG